MGIFTSLQNLIKRAVITNPGSDDKAHPISQVSYDNNHVADCNMIYPYGMYANAPIDSLVVMWSVAAQEANRAGIATLPNNRFKNLKSSEVAFGNPLTGTKTVYKDDGNLEITVTADKVVTISGACTINVTGNTTITSPAVTIDGDLTVTGEITGLTGSSSLSLSGIRGAFNPHLHGASPPPDTSM